MTFLILVAVVVIAYLAWRIVDQLPDIVYRMSEIQRDVADLRRRLADDQAAQDDQSSAVPNDGEPEDAPGEDR